MSSDQKRQAVRHPCFISCLTPNKKTLFVAHCCSVQISKLHNISFSCVSYPVFSFLPVMDRDPDCCRSLTASVWQKCRFVIACIRSTRFVCTQEIDIGVRELSAVNRLLSICVEFCPFRCHDPPQYLFGSLSAPGNTSSKQIGSLFDPIADLIQKLCYLFPVLDCVNHA